MYKIFARFHTLYRGIGEGERVPCQTTGRFSLAPFLSDTRKERGTMILEGLFSGLEAQSEITDLLDMLYGSYGERLIATYKLAS
jgi:hypothetical protein